MLNYFQLFLYFKSQSFAVFSILNSPNHFVCLFNCCKLLNEETNETIVAYCTGKISPSSPPKPPPPPQFYVPPSKSRRGKGP